MTIDTHILVLLACVIAIAIGLKRDSLLIFAPACIAFVVTVIVWMDSSDWRKAQVKAEAEQAARDAQPHVVREADGCKVYAFKNGGWHYFTRCGATVTTEQNWTVPVSCGKNCTKQEPRQEIIVTEENK